MSSHTLTGCTLRIGTRCAEFGSGGNRGEILVKKCIGTVTTYIALMKNRAMYDGYAQAGYAWGYARMVPPAILN